MGQEISLGQLRNWLLHYADVIDAQADYLTELDAAIGDADHGANMVRGMTKVRTRLRDETDACSDIGGLMRTVGMILIGSIGGAVGPLYGAFFVRAGKETNGDVSISLTQLAHMFRCGVEGVQQRGKAQLAEKTMIDVLEPAVDALEEAASAGETPTAALRSACVVAHKAMLHTIDMEATKGRASYLGPRSIGHQDPGATSSYLLIEALAETVAATQ
jgi:dihydroxyacetone kinase-like protein